MSSCRTLRDTIHHATLLANRRAALLRTVADALDGDISSPDGIAALVALRIAIRAEVGQ